MHNLIIYTLYLTYTLEFGLLGYVGQIERRDQREGANQ